MGGVRYQGVGKFLQGSGEGDYIVWVGNVGPFGVNGKEDRGEEGVREAAGTQLARTYIERRQATVDQWVALRPLFEVFTMETGYIGGCG